MKPLDWLLAVVISLILWAILCFGAAIVLAEEGKQGLDILGLAKHDANMIAQEIDNGTAIGYLDSTFGNPYPNLGALLASGKVPAIRGHLRDFTCYRGGRCPSGYPSASDPRPVEEAAKRLSRFLGTHSGVTCYVSPALEHDVKDRKIVEKWYAILKRVVPSCIPVCSAFTGYCPSGVLVERHGNSGRADLRSNDGDSLFDSNSAAYRTSGRVLTFGWIPEFNGRVSGEKEFIAPLKRINWAGRDLVRQAVRVMRKPEPQPVTKCKQIKAPELFKTNAEYYGKAKDDGRGNKGLWITSKAYPRIDIVALEGRSVGCLKYFGPFSGGGYRHYVGTCSGETPVGLMDKLGSEWGLLKAGGSCWLFNAIRRQGSFR